MYTIPFLFPCTDSLIHRSVIMFIICSLVIPCLYVLLHLQQAGILKSILESYPWVKSSVSRSLCLTRPAPVSSGSSGSGSLQSPSSHPSATSSPNPPRTSPSPLTPPNLSPSRDRRWWGGCLASVTRAPSPRCPTGTTA